MLNDGAVYIIAHPSADSSILAVANQTFQYLSNGDDAFALTLAGATASSCTIVDIIRIFKETQEVDGMLQELQMEQKTIH